MRRLSRRWIALVLLGDDDADDPPAERDALTPRERLRLLYRDRGWPQWLIEERLGAESWRDNRPRRRT